MAGDDIANNMLTGFAIAVLIAATLILALLFIAAVVRYRGKRVVTCPETKQPVGVEMDS